MAVAPLDKVRQVVEYALSQIPAEKLILGIPNYGYDWQLPYERGVTRAQTIGNVQAVDLAVENGALIRYAQTAQSPWLHIRKAAWIMLSGLKTSEVFRQNGNSFKS